MKIKRLLAFLLILTLFQTSCSAAGATATDIMFETVSALDDYPDSDILFSGADKYSENYADEGKLKRLYAGISPEGLYASYAISLSRDDRIYEIHIFKAVSEAKGIQLEKLMNRRKDMLQSGDIYLYNEENYENVICAAKTIRRGVYVILLLTGDNAEAEKTILKMI